MHMKIVHALFRSGMKAEADWSFHNSILKSVNTNAFVNITVRLAEVSSWIPPTWQQLFDVEAEILHHQVSYQQCDTFRLWFQFISVIYWCYVEVTTSPLNLPFKIAQASNELASATVEICQSFSFIQGIFCQFSLALLMPTTDRADDSELVICCFRIILHHPLSSPVSKLQLEFGLYPSTHGSREWGSQDREVFSLNKDTLFSADWLGGRGKRSSRTSETELP